MGQIMQMENVGLIREIHDVKQCLPYHKNFTRHLLGCVFAAKEDQEAKENSLVKEVERNLFTVYCANLENGAGEWIILQVRN